MIRRTELVPEIGDVVAVKYGEHGARFNVEITDRIPKLEGIEVSWFGHDPKGNPEIYGNPFISFNTEDIIAYGRIPNA